MIVVFLFLTYCIKLCKFVPKIILILKCANYKGPGFFRLNGQTGVAKNVPLLLDLGQELLLVITVYGRYLVSLKFYALVKVDYY